VAEFQRQRKRGEQLRDADRADQQSSSRSRRQPKA
jgi:hypothetical protein